MSVNASDELAALRALVAEQALHQSPFPTPVDSYRRIHVLLVREGWVVNAKRMHRLYNELDLQLSKKAPKRRVKAKLREDRRRHCR